MTRDLRNRIKKCSRCRKYEAAPPVMPMKPLACSRPGELLHVDFTSIEETVPLAHFLKKVISYKNVTLFFLFDIWCCIFFFDL